MSILRTNGLGKGIAALGVAVVGVSAWVGIGDPDSTPLNKGPLIGYGVGAGTILFGLYIRLVGNAIRWLGIVTLVAGALAFLVAIVHGMLVHWLDWTFLNFGYEQKYDIGKIEAYVAFSGLGTALAGFLLGYVGELLARTEQEEARDAALAAQSEDAARRRIGPAREGPRGDVCANCGKPMGTLTHALKCPVCRQYWCADCCGRSGENELICPVDRVDNLGRAW